MTMFQHYIVAGAAAVAAAAASEEATKPKKKYIRRVLTQSEVDRHMARARRLQVDRPEDITGIDIFNFAKVFESDVYKEFGVQDSAEAARSLWTDYLEWDYRIAIEAETRYYLNVGDVTLSDIQYPYLMCSTAPGESALQRKNDIFNVVELQLPTFDVDITADFFFENHISALQTVFSDEDMACFVGQMRASVVAVVVLLDNFDMIPMSSFAKMRSNVVEDLLALAYPNKWKETQGGASIANDGDNSTQPPGVGEEDLSDTTKVDDSDSRLDVVLCAGVPLEELERLGDKIVTFMKTKDQDAGRSFVSQQSPYASMGDVGSLPGRVAFWQKVFDAGIDSPQGCNDFLERLETTVIDSETPGDAVGVSIRLADAEDPNASTDTDVACVLGLIFGMSLLPQICSIELARDIDVFNLEAAWITQGGSSGSKNKPFWDKGITGKNQVVAVSDTGVDVSNCYFWDKEVPVIANGGYDMIRRKIIQYDAFVDDTDEFGGHGTHVAGTIMGRKAENGVNEADGKADGVAYDARLAFIDCSAGGSGLSIPADKNRLLGTGTSGGARLHSASWGSTLNPYRYDTMSRDIDSYLHGNWDMLMLVAAGNSGRGNTAKTLGSPSVAKNVLAVGASQSFGDDLSFNQKGIDYIADFSSEGPTSDGRIAPQVVGPGQSILSANAIPAEEGECDPLIAPSGGSGTAGGLTYKQGTSMATPAIAGAAALVRQYFQDGFYPSGARNTSQAASIDPSGTLVKAVLINSGQVMVGKDNGFSTGQSSMYDSIQGFGRVSLADTLRLQGENSINARIVDRVAVADGQTKAYRVTVNSTVCTGKDMRATLVWADPPGASGCVKCLVNDLDLTLVNEKTGEIYRPNGLTSGKDSTNNVERVIVPSGDLISGDTFLANVFAANLDRAEQPFSVSMSGCFSFEGQGDIGPLSPDAANAIGSWVAAVVALVASTYFIASEIGHIF